MQDFPRFSRMPGATDAMDTEAFEPGEIAGMRSAAWILVTTGALGVVASATSPSRVLLTSAIDVFLGVQLLRLQHNWRAWAMLRAWVGLAVGLFISLMTISTMLILRRAPAGMSNVGSVAAALAQGLGQAAYAGSLLLLLFGVPSIKRVIVGRIAFGISLALMIVGLVVTASRQGGLDRASAEPVDPSAVVYRVAGDSDYHRADCPLIKGKVPVPQSIYIQGSGNRPCLVCKPRPRALERDER